MGVMGILRVSVISTDSLKPVLSISVQLVFLFYRITVEVLSLLDYSILNLITVSSTRLLYNFVKVTVSSSHFREAYPAVTIVTS